MSPSSDLPSAPRTAGDLSLLRRFEPQVRYTRGEHCYPMPVEPYVERCSLWVHYPDGRDEQLVPAGQLTMEALVQPHPAPFGSVLFLRLVQPQGIGAGARALAAEASLKRRSQEAFRPGPGRLSRGGLLPRLFDAGFSATLLLRGRVPGANSAAAHLGYLQWLEGHDTFVYYGRVVRDRGWVVLQYWFFFDYNPWRSGFHGVNDHESDWEQILVYLYEKGGRLVPAWVAFASHDFHGDDLRRRWDDRAELEIAEGHPVVYAGAGSHASYFRRGEYQAEVNLPLPRWLHASIASVQNAWGRLLGLGKEPRPPFRIPFVDFARGDGLTIGPGGKKPWTPVVIDESVPWVSKYRGLWGLFARDPLSGENAPGGPMYNRDGTPRASWYDPLGFAGLDKIAPPSREAAILRSRIAERTKAQKKLESEIDRKTDELQNLGTLWRAMDSKPHLAKRHEALGKEIRTKGKELSEVRKELAQSRIVLDGMRQRLEEIRRSAPTDPQAHIRHRAHPIVPTPASAALEAWASFSIALLFFGVAALLVFAPGAVLPGIVLLVIGFGLVESALRRTFAVNLGNLTALLALLSLVLVAIAYWQIALAALFAAIGAVLVWQKVQELRG
jgi:hypothetical protein